MRETPLPFSPPNVGEEEIAEVVATLRSDWITTGPRTRSFEERFAGAVDAPGALALSSCTAALHVALAALGVGPGDVVLTTTMTFCSTVHVIEQVGARPVLVDVEPDTLNLDPTAVVKALDGLSEGERPVALMPVHFAGHPCDMDALIAIARERDLAIVEDAAHALPAQYRGVPIGSVAATPDVRRAIAFSFYATKNLTTAEGGMLTAAPELLDEARIWSLHGMSRDAWRRYADMGSWFYEVVRPGFKYNMTDIQAALGLHQLAKLGGFHERRLAIVERYRAGLAGCDAVELPVQRADVGHAWHLYPIRLDLDLLAIDRARFIEELAARNIGASVHFIPVHEHPYYRDRYGFEPNDLPVAHAAYERLVSLPIHPRLTDADVDDVVEAIHDIVVQHRR
jgi:dTDP-4-amino-4,6-dideoxygalactose transaminase